MSASQFPPLEGKPSDKRCSNCSAKMTAYQLPAHYDGTVEIDVCMDCNAIWFDHYESTSLSPDGTVALFQLINERGGTATSAASKFSEGLRCVTCGDSMKLTQDQVKGTRFAYQACRHGHGRFTTFYNFLSEKQFVRELTKAERAKLAATVKQVRCSGCGAAVNIGAVDACEYCRAPISVFDRDAAKKAIDHYLQERQKVRPVADDRRTSGRPAGDQWSSYDRADLGADILYALSRAVTRGVSSGMGRTVPAGAAGGAMSPVFADSGGAAGSTMPDATSALFGADALTGAAGHSASALASATDSAGSVLPNATDALFGGGGAGGGMGEGMGGIGSEIAGAFGDASSAGIADAATDVASSLGSSVAEAASDGALDVAGEVAGDVASSAGEGIVDLVTDGIGSLLGALFD